MKNNVKRTIFLFLLVFYVSMLIIGAVITIPNGVASNDKLMHFLEFFGLSLIIIKTLQLYNVKVKYVLAFLISCLFALVSEAVQLATITRTFSVYDLFADVIGIIFGLVIFKLVISKWKF